MRKKNCYYSVFVLLVIVVGCATKKSASQKAQLLDNSLNEATYAGVAEDKSELNISLVKDGESYKVKRLGYKFTGSMRVADVRMEDGRPFGTMINGELEFQFPVFISFNLGSSITNGKVGMADYKATLSSKEGNTICVLERIYEIAPEYEFLTMNQITMEGGMPDGTDMLEKYIIVLEPSK